MRDRAVVAISTKLYGALAIVVLVTLVLAVFAITGLNGIPARNAFIFSDKTDAMRERDLADGQIAVCQVPARSRSCGRVLFA